MASARAIIVLLLCLPAVAAADFDPSLHEHLEGRVVASVSINGANVTKSHVIWREIQTVSGEPLNMETLRDDFIRLENLGIFAAIEIRIYADENDNQVFIGFDFVEMPWMIPLLKFKYTEQDGWSVGPGLTSLNMLGYGVTLSGTILFGGTTQFIVESRGPWFTTNSLFYNLRAALLERYDSLNDFNETSFELTPWMSYFLDKHTRVGGMLGYFKMNSDVDGITLSDDNGDEFGRAASAIIFDSRNSWRNPTGGWWTELEVGYWFGDGEWFQSNLDLRRWQPIASRHTLAAGFLFSGQTGTVGEDIPQYFMYRMGGANSIRGYDIDVLGKELFGQNQTIFTAEYLWEALPLREWPVLNWAFSAGMQVAGFVDYGDAWNNDDGFDFERGKWGGGFGVRLLVPGINVARLDIGFGEGGEVFFHFGAWDKFTAQRLRLR
jgi:outer membrane protein assembly factor BamA